MHCPYVWAYAYPNAQEAFRRAEGFELMVRFVREKRYAKHGALKVRAHGDTHIPNGRPGAVARAGEMRVCVCSRA